MRPLTLLFATACTAAAPFEGPGTDAEGPLIAIATHTRVKKGAGRAFDDAVDAIDQQLASQPGFVGSSLRARIPGRERWTLTVWEDEDALLTFVTSEAHLEAMVDQAELIDGVYSARWELDAGDLPPDWSEALDQLEAQRPSRPAW